MGKVNLTIQDCGIGIHHLVEVEHIGMNKIYTSILRLGFTSRARLSTLLLLRAVRGCTNE